MGKLVLHIVENGNTHNLSCDECTIIEELHKIIESSYGIPVKNQLLLCLDQKLDPHYPLSFYKLPSHKREVFLFNKARMRNNSQNPEPEQVHIIDVPDPPILSSSRNPHPLDDASDPALKALPSYERQFTYHFQLGKAIYQRALVKFEACESLLHKQKVQERAMGIARGTLDHFFSMIVQNYTDFEKYYLQQCNRHNSLLANFRRDMDRLRAIIIIPSLQSDNRKCLLDFVKEESLLKSVEDCKSSQRQFDRKVSEFKQEFGDLKRNAESLFAERPLFIKDLELSIKEHQQPINELASIMQALSKDVDTVRKLVDDCVAVASRLSSSLRPHNAVSALGPIYDSHEKSYLPQMQSCEDSISTLLNHCQAKKNEMNIFVHNYLQKIAYMQHTIKDIRYKFSVFQEALNRQDDQFKPLRIVCGIGYSYRACLAEVVRRKAAMKIYMGKAGQLAEKLANERDSEIRRRDEFFKIHSNYIPRDVLDSMGLYDSPNPCDVNVIPFDTDLLDIDVTDIDRFAPESVLGRSVKKVRARSLLPISGDGSESGEVDIHDKHGSSQLIGGSELVEISGTSKIEVENAKLKAELASKIALLCSMSAELDYESLDQIKLDNVLKNASQKTLEALHLKDEYQKHLQALLEKKQTQCESYEKRIQELETKLSDKFIKGSKLSDDNDDESMSTSGVKTENMEDEIIRTGEAYMPKHDKELERSDQIVDSSTILNPQPDSSMPDLSRGKGYICDEDKEKAQSGTSREQDIDAKASSLVLELQNALEEKSNSLDHAETKVMELNDEITKLTMDLEINRKLLGESQMNCAHLENCLLEAREEAQTHLSAADRRASEYSPLRASCIKMCSLFGRLKNCVLSATITDFADSLHSLAQSSSSCANENEDDSTAEFLECVRILSSKVRVLSRERAESLDRSLKLESANEQLHKELHEKKDLVNTLYKKHQVEKQANKEKISFGRLELHEIAAFVLNSSGHYEAINRTCPYYYLSDESIALFADHLPIRPRYIVGQIVHIERQIVKYSPILTSGRAEDRVDILAGSPDALTLTSRLTFNPYGVPIGCEYFVVTLAILPEGNVGGSNSATPSS